jgi:hypothetical protein
VLRISFDFEGSKRYTKQFENLGKELNQKFMRETGRISPLAANLLFSFLIIILILAWGGIARPAEVVANLDDIAKAVESFFPKVSGSVTKVDGREVDFDLGRESGISPGLVLTVYRLGAVFTHPLTGEALGRFEETLGRVEVLNVEEHDSRGVLLDSDARVAAGDGIRLTGGRIPLAVASGPSNISQIVAREFSVSLSEIGRFHVIEEGEGAGFNSDPVGSARAHGADYLLRIDADSVDRAVSFKMSLVSTPKGSEIGHLDARVEPSSKSDLILENIQNYLLLHPN